MTIKIIGEFYFINIREGVHLISVLLNVNKASQRILDTRYSSEDVSDDLQDTSAPLQKN